MKTVRSIITAMLFSAGMLFVTHANAQTTPADNFVLSAAVDAGLPTGSERGGTTFTLGGDIQLQYGLTDRFAVTLTTGGYHFFPKQNIEPVRRESFGLGPIKGGIRKFFSPNLYLGAEAGVAYLYTEHGYSGDPPSLILAPALGYANQHWDLGLRYENYSGQGYS